jgi:hypothetical protein
MHMLHRPVALVALLALAAPAARAVDCPEILNYGQLYFEQPFDTSQPPAKLFGQNTFIPVVAIHEAALDAIDSPFIQDHAWCNDLAADTIALSTSLMVPSLAESHADAAISDGSLAIYASGSTPESSDTTLRIGTSLVQIGFRDVIQVGGAGTDPVPLTLHRSVNGDWTVDEGQGNTLYVEGTRTFWLTIDELAQADGPGLNTYTRRLLIKDSQAVGFVNADQDYVFDATPGHTLVLTLYLEAGLMCGPNRTFGDPPVQYGGCYGFVDFSGGPYGAAIGMTVTGPPGIPLSADSGYQYVPEPDTELLGEAAVAALLCLRPRRIGRA